MKGHGSFRDRIARTLNTAYGDGLLSEHTLAQRLDVLCGSHVIEPAGLLHPGDEVHVGTVRLLVD
jgi:hypothetical protein